MSTYYLNFLIIMMKLPTPTNLKEVIEDVYLFSHVTLKRNVSVSRLNHAIEKISVSSQIFVSVIRIRLTQMTKYSNISYVWANFLVQFEDGRLYVQNLYSLFTNDLLNYCYSTINLILWEINRHSKGKQQKKKKPKQNKTKQKQNQKRKRKTKTNKN